MSDYYEVLGVARNATDDEIKRAYRALARAVPPRREPRRSRGRGAVQGDQRRVRDAARSRAPPPLRHVRRRRRARGGGPGQRRGDAFGFGDLFDAFFGGDPFGDAARPVRRARPTPRRWSSSTSREAAFGATAHGRRPPARSRASAATARAASPARTRRAATCAAAPARCARCAGRSSARSSPRRRASRAARPGSASPRRARDVPRRRARASPRRSIDVEVPAGIDDGQRLRLAGRGPAAPRGGVARRPLRHRARRARPALRAPRRRPPARAARSRSPRRRSAPQLEVETLDGPEELDRHPGHPARHVFRLKGRGVPALRGRGAATCSSRSTSRCPTRLIGRGGRAAALARASCAARRSRTRRTRACSPASGPRSSSAVVAR